MKNLKGVHLHAVVCHDFGGVYSVIIRGLNETGGQVRGIPEIKLPCKSYDHAREVVAAYNQSGNRLISRIQSALGTGEEGDDLVAVASAAHEAEMSLAARQNAEQEQH